MDQEDEENSSRLWLFLKPKAWAIHKEQPKYFSLNLFENISLDIRVRFWAVFVPLLQN
jgi:hypothetical protein